MPGRQSWPLVLGMDLRTAIVLIYDNWDISPSQTDRETGNTDREEPLAYRITPCADRKGKGQSYSGQWSNQTSLIVAY